MAIIYNIFKYLLPLVFFVSGVAHFIVPEQFVRIFPEIVPFKTELVYASGVVEVVAAILFCLRSFTRPMALLFMIFLIGVYPLHIYMALNPGLYPDLTVTQLWVRCLFQLVLIGWAYYFYQDRSSPHA